MFRQQMFSLHHLLLLLLGLIIHLIYVTLYDTNKKAAKTKEILIIGILSSRNHFEQRSLLRKGIRKQINSSEIKLKFIVGKYPCRIPVEDRIDIYKCDADPFLKPEFDRFYFHSIQNVSNGEIFVPGGSIGFDFIVNHKIILHDFGLYDHNKNGFKGSLKVVLYETLTKKLISSKTFLPFGGKGSSHGNHVYRHKTALKIPKGFRGTIVVDGASDQDPLIKSKNCSIDDGGGLISYFPGYRYALEVDTFPDYIGQKGKLLCSFCGPSFSFSSFDVSVEANSSSLSIERNKRYSKLDNDLVTQEIDLDTEQKEHGDLLFVDVVESYRNLSRKMLLFYEWLHDKKFDFVFKTDDDCYVNMTGISLFLQDLHIPNYTWIGNFRTNFIVNLFGKWEDIDYKSTTYPPFACGSGYLLSKDIVKWIFLNRFHLKIFQGEDVSLGIWLSAINVNLVMDPRFQCFGGEKVKNIFSSPDNNITFLKHLYGV